ncbi:MULTISPECIES: helix-turn-helix domain-containing protein [unclassified Rhizobium]|uniref:helix-turn-helix domain-containing protein n=1 Tax=unclassified Rhizobium TaxID=2613769 RepID=UPI00382DB5B8
MMQVDAKTYATGAEMMEAYRLLQQRLRAAPLRRQVPTPVPKPPAPVLVERVPQPHLPYWMGCDIEFDAHVQAWRAWRGIHERNSSLYVRNRAAELGFTFDKIRSPDRHRKVVAARQLLMYEVKKLFDRSYPEIGRLFGGRDHTTVLHAVKKIERLKAEGKI